MSGHLIVRLIVNSFCGTVAPQVLIMRLLPVLGLLSVIAVRAQVPDSLVLDGVPPISPGLAPTSAAISNFAPLPSIAGTPNAARC